MKIRICAALLIAMLILSALTGCAAPMADTVVLTRLPVPAAADPKVTEPVQTHPPGTAAALPEQKTASSGITEEEAMQIALKHADLTQDQVTHLRAHYDRDDRIPEYDVEFRQGRWEYEYEIHAETGTILSWEKDD